LHWFDQDKEFVEDNITKIYGLSLVELTTYGNSIIINTVITSSLDSTRLSDNNYPVQERDFLMRAAALEFHPLTETRSLQPMAS